MGTAIGDNGRRRKARKSVPPLSCVPAAAALLLVQSSTAKDLDVLSEFVAPAYTAMNFAAICARDRPWALSQPRGLRGSAVEYAEHVKDEAIASLTHDEALKVLKAAADASGPRRCPTAGYSTPRDTIISIH